MLIKLKHYLARIVLMLAGAMLMPLAGVIVHQNQFVQTVEAAQTPADDAKLPTFMPNAELRYLVWDNYNDQIGTQPVASPADMTKKDLSQLTDLSYSPNSFTSQEYNDSGPVTGGNGAIGPTNTGNYSLEGLQYATNLQKLSIPTDLNRGNAFLHSNITDISPLADLHNLTYIDLHGNRISDATPLSNLKKVTYLNISNNCISDLSSLNATQYSYFYYPMQQVVFDTQHLSGNSYTWQQPFEGKMPQGTTYSPSNTVIRNSSMLQISSLDATLYQGFFAGAQGTMDASGNLTYNNLHAQQSPGPLSVSLGGTTYRLLQNPDTYYMVAYYLDSKINTYLPIFMYHLPYQDNVEAIKYQIIPYDQDTKAKISDYTPVEKTGMPGDVVEVPTIPGYTPVAKTVTIPEAGGDIQAWYTKNPVAKGTVTVHYQDDQGNQLKDSASSTGDVDSDYTAPMPDPTIAVNGTTYEYVGVKKGESIPKAYTDQPQSFTYVYSKKSVDADLNYTVKTVDSNGQDLGKGYTASGKSGIVIKAPVIDGYTAADPTQVVLDKDGQVIAFVYTKNSTGGGTGGGGITTPTIPATPLTPATPTTPATPIVPATPVTPTGPNIAKKGEVVYAVKKVYLYQQPTFKKSQRVTSYVKKPRINRPMFVVTDYARSSNGALRYKVRDVNHLTKNKGKTGYLTANTKFTRPVYYHGKAKTITVINLKGVNAYRKANLTNKTRNYKQGTVLKVKGLANHNLTTRFVLSNGRYVTANRKLVITGKYQAAKVVQARGAINRYSKANLTKKNKHYTKQTKKVFKVKRWEYSQANSTKKHGTLRYQVAGGYITGNAKYVKVIK